MKESTEFKVGVFFLRLAAGITLAAAHGWPKMRILLGSDPIHFPDPLGIGAKPSFVLVALSEFFCALMVAAGFAVRLNSLVIIFSMFIAAFIQHNADILDTGEKAFLYLLIFTSIFITGPGRCSVHNLLPGKDPSSSLIRFMTK